MECELLGYELPTEAGTRRQFLYGLGASVGAVALSDLLNRETGAAYLGDAEKRSGGPDAGGDAPLAVRDPHVPSQAKACIFLMMAGGPSHIDTFDPKPKLRELHMQKFVRQDRFASAMASGDRYFVQSPFKFRRAGAAGLTMCEQFENLAGVADDLCVYSGCQGESINHPTALYHMNTGNRFGGDPAMGAWTLYGLGTPNQNLPGFVVLPEVAYPQGGA
ncbi:MAG: DUF1501 domain-containing protein, partial [Planctomycetota bacterium]